MNEIEWCDLIYNVGTVVNDKYCSWVVASNILSYSLLFMNGIPKICSKTILFC